MKRGICLALLGSSPLAIAWFMVVLSGTDSTFPQERDTERVQRDLTNRCAVCHAGQADSMRNAPHLATLQRADTPANLEAFASAENLRPADGDRFVNQSGKLVLHSPRLALPVPVDWIFGSGSHARTPVSSWISPSGETAMLEHRLSWYPPGLVDLTLGSAEGAGPRTGLESCGKLLAPEGTRDCFGCHSTALPFTKEGAIDWQNMVPGVGCVRCHPGGQSHVDAAEAGRRDLKIERWRDLTPLDSIRRCGECHRRDDQLTPDEIRPDNLLLVRFAPVGLSQSACFTRQTRRLDCVTCHDPHRPAETDPAWYAKVCLDCHSGAGAREPACSRAPRSTECVLCHLPKIEVQPHLRFSDHWIRVRDDR